MLGPLAGCLQYDDLDFLASEFALSPTIAEVALSSECPRPAAESPENDKSARSSDATTVDGLESSIKAGRYTLRARAGVNKVQRGKQASEIESQKQSSPPIITSWRVHGKQTNGFLIPMQPLHSVQSSGRSSSLSEIGTPLDMQTHQGAHSPAEHSLKPLDSISNELSEPSAIPEETDAYSLVPQCQAASFPMSEVRVRVVTSGKVQPLPSNQEKAVATEVKRRKRTGGVPTSRVTRSTSKSAQPPQVGEATKSCEAQCAQSLGEHSGQRIGLDGGHMPERKPAVDHQPPNSFNARADMTHAYAPTQEVSHF